MLQPPELELREVMRCLEPVLRCNLQQDFLAAKTAAVQYLMQAAKKATMQPRWPEAEGRSLIGTLRKAWGEEAPVVVTFLVRILLDWRRAIEPGDTAAEESIAMGVAHLLPVLR